MKNLLITSAIVAAVGILPAQQAPHTQAPPPVAKPVPFEACSQAPDASGLTGCERMALMNVQLAAEPYRGQLQAIGQRAQALMAGILAAHPGYTFEPPSEEYPQGRLVRTPPPAPQRDPAAAPAPPAPAPGLKAPPK